jgi:hypothetical protein
MIYRTANYQQVPANSRSLGLLIVFLVFPVIAISILIFASRPQKIGDWSYAVLLMIPLGLLWSLLSLYKHAYRNLTYELTQEGLHVKFIRAITIPWPAIESIQRVNPLHIVHGRIWGLAGGDLMHGLYSTQFGRAWVWLAGEKEGIFIRTARRNYVIAPENIGEFEKSIESKIRK